MNEKIELVCKILDDKLAEDIVIIDFENKGPLCDYFIICTAKNNRHSDSLINFLKEGLEDKYQIYHIDDADGGWCIVDLNDTIVHIFLSEERNKYQLEKLWSDHKILSM